jgi:hypothetical protein
LPPATESEIRISGTKLPFVDSNRHVADNAWKLSEEHSHVSSRRILAFTKSG